MNSPKKRHRVRSAFFLVFVVLITLWLVLASTYLILRTLALKEEKLPQMFGYQISVETTEKMGEVVPKGCAVLVEEIPNPVIGDVILYKTGLEEKPTVGRIEEILSFDTEPEYAVSFDAETQTDVHIDRSSVYGRVVYVIPWLGYVVDYLNSFNGIIYAVLLPGAFLIVILVIRMILSIRSSRREENEEEEEESFTISSIPIERESDTELAPHNEELDAIWRRRQNAFDETEDIVTDQDMIHQLSNLNNTFAVDSSAVQKQEEKQKNEAEKIVSEISASTANSEKVSSSASEEKLKNADFDQLVSTLGLESKESSDLVSMLRQYGITDQAAVESVQRAAPFIRPVLTDHSVELDLKNNPAKRVQIISDEHGKFLLVESDGVETKIKLPF